MLPDGEQGSLIVLTQDPLVISNLTRRVARVGRRAAVLKHELASLHLARIDELEPRLATKAHSPPLVRSMIEAGRASLKQADSRLAQGSYEDVYLQARRADQSLYQVERACWEKITQATTAPLSVPLGVAFETLPEYWKFVGEYASTARRENRLAAGEFEDLELMLRSGWRHFQHPQSGILTDVKLSPDRVHGGKLALRLQVNPAKPEQPPTLVETAPLWVTSPPVPVETGQVICIHGWVNLPTAPTGSVDGLLIVDSLGGEPLAERIGQTAGWRELTLFRAAARSESLVVTIALTGLGEAWLDDFSIQLVERGDGPAEQAQQPGKRVKSAARR